MNEYHISQVQPADRAGMAGVDALLSREGLVRDSNLDYTCAVFDADGSVIATGSCFGNTLRCFAVSDAHQGEGLLNLVLTHLIGYQAEQGIFHLFLYTKPDAAAFFADLGFHEIARVPGSLVFMENRRSGFSGYLRKLTGSRRDGVSAAVVMNANPFTFGHQYLAQQAAARCDALHLFVVSEDLSEFPFEERRDMVRMGTAGIRNVILHDCGPYIISAATFPGYFLKEPAQITEAQARLDIEVFKQIARVLNITERWVGEEPDSVTTGIYNRVMAESLPAAGIRCVVLPRKTASGNPISASTVRECLRRGDLTSLRTMVPETTFRCLTGHITK